MYQSAPDAFRRSRIILNLKHFACEARGSMGSRESSGLKALISLEGLGRQYDPEFRLIERGKPFLDSAMRERYQPAEAARRAQETLKG